MQKSRANISPELNRLIELLSKMPGLGPKSARRAALHLLKRPEALLKPLADAMAIAAEKVMTCEVCGNLDTISPCSICQNDGRENSIICVVAEVGDLWAFERAGGFKGNYHVLGGLLNPFDGMGPNDLKIKELVKRLETGEVKEVVLALAATIDGQSTAHYIADILAKMNIKLTRLSHGLPIGGELDHIDEGTLMAALKSRLEI